MRSEALFRVKRAGGAPHKPLLLLSALDHYREGRERLIPAQELEIKFRHLAAAAGVPGSPSIQEPFWRLINDHVWEVANIGSSEAIKPEPRIPKAKAAGGLTSEIFSEIALSDLSALMRKIVEAYFSNEQQRQLKAALGV
jgi:hypothetical protein